MNPELKDRVIDLKLSDRRKIFLVINDIFPAVVFFLTGMEMLKIGESTPLAYINFLLGILLIIAGVRELRSISKEGENKINWLDLVSGSAMIFNTIEMYKPWKGIQPAYFYAIIAVFLILKGLSIIKISNLWRLKISSSGFKIRTGIFSKSGFLWDEIVSISRNNKKLIISSANGEKIISLHKIQNADEVFENIKNYFNTIKSLK